jgi:hypothetical protein
VQVRLAMERLYRNAVAGLPDEPFPARALQALFDQRAPVRFIGWLAQLQLRPRHFSSA